MEPTPNELVNKREEMSVKIRRNKREEIFKKTRPSMDPKTDHVNIFLQSGDPEEEQRIIQRMQSHRDRVFTGADIDELVKAVRSEDIAEVHFGVYGLRKMLSHNTPPIQLAIDADMVTPLVKYMSMTQYPLLQVEASWALTNVASGDRQQTQTIIDKGGLRLFVQSLLSNNLDMVEQCIWAIGNISADSVHVRDMLNSMGAIDNMMVVYPKINSHKERYPTWVWAISNLCRGVPQPDIHQVIKPAQHFIEALQKRPNFEVLNDSVWALTNIVMTINAQEIMDVRIASYQAIGPALTEPETFASITSAISNSYHMMNIQIPLIRLLGNVAYMDNSNTDRMFKLNVMTHLMPLFALNNMQVTRDLIWTLSNFAVGSEDVVSAIVSNDPLIEHIFLHADCHSPMVKKEVFWVLSNLTRKATLAQVHQLCDKGLLASFVGQLVVENNDVETLNQILKSVKRVLRREKKVDQNQIYLQLEELNGFQALESLQHHQETVIYTYATKIINEFCELQEEF